MTRKKTAGSEQAEPAGDIDLKAAYKYDPAEISTEITVSRYSNLAYIQVSPRDVCIDFLEMPGIRKGGKMVVGGARIYMSHDSARRLADTLGDVLEKAGTGAFMKGGRK
jgi:hypothetical protein